MPRIGKSMRSTNPVPSFCTVTDAASNDRLLVFLKVITDPLR
jgi:hypothetical protein